MARKEAVGVKIRKAKHNPDIEFHVESKWGMRYPKAVYKPTGEPITAVAHGISVASAAEWVCLVDTAFAHVNVGGLKDPDPVRADAARNDGLRALEVVRNCFGRKSECPAKMREKCIKKW